MSKIPTYEGGVSPETGSIAPKLDASAFGGHIGLALGKLGQDIDNTSDNIATLAKHKKNLEDQRWVSSTIVDQKEQLDKFMVDPNVSHAEDIADQVRLYTQKQMAAVTPDQAPSPEAYALFKQHYGAYAGQEVGDAYSKGAANLVNNTKASFNDQINQTITTYRESQSPDRLKNLVGSVATVKGSIQESFGAFDPKTADGLNQDLIVQATLAVMGDNPAAARSFLKSESSIDEQTRLRLNSEIDQSMRAKDTVARMDTLSIEHNELDAAQAGNLTESKLTLDSFKSIYPPGEAEARYKAHTDNIKMYATGNQVVQSVASQSPANLNAALSKVLDKSKITGDDASYQAGLRDFTAQQLRSVIKLQNDDVVAWQEQYQPAVKQAKAALETTSQDQLPAAITRLNGLKLMYQGAPPRDGGGQLLVSDAESKLFLNRPQNELSVLSQNSSEDLAGKLNASKPKEFIKTMGDLLATYPDEKQQNIVFNDLVTKGKLSQQYQFAWANKSEWWIDTYVGAIHAGGDIKLSKEDDKSVEDYVLGSKAWLNLSSVMNTDGYQRSKETRGFREGAIQFAKALVSTGKSPNDAANVATDLLIGSNLGFTKVNGHPLVISRMSAPNTSKRTDAEVAQIGEHLQYVPEYLPYADIDQKPFTALQSMGTEDAKLSSLQDHLKAHGFWQALDDNRAVLYSVDERGIQPFEVRDKQGKPFIVDYRTLPGPALLEYMEVAGKNPAYGPKDQLNVPHRGNETKRLDWLYSE